MTLIVEHYEIRVIEVDDNRIEKVKITLLSENVS
ncbi:MAG: hypothetical protein MSA56_00275 [Clostridium sp.]|nr:hypothetical protein [Clostridium sp.]